MHVPILIDNVIVYRHIVFCSLLLINLFALAFVTKSWQLRQRLVIDYIESIEHQSIQ